MVRVVAAETQLASDGPEPPTESHTTEGMAKTGLREPQAVFATGHLSRSVSSACLRSAGTGFSCLFRLKKLKPFAAKRAKVDSARKSTSKAAPLGENAHKATWALCSVNKRAKLSL